MNIRPIFTRRRLAVAAAIATGAVLVPVAASALNNPAEHYTGCLNTTKGTIAKVKAGDAPMSACSSAEKELTVSGGDVTGVVAGTGLLGGATSGSATLGLAAGYALPQGCAAGSVPKKSSTGWACATLPAPTTSNIGRRMFTTSAITLDEDNASTVSSCARLGFGPDSSTKASSAFSLPAGVYQPSMAGNTRWWINWYYDADGKGFVKARIVQTLNGVRTTMSTWARAETVLKDGLGLPYNQDFAPFTANPAATYTLDIDATAWACSRARLLDASAMFVLIG